MSGCLGLSQEWSQGPMLCSRCHPRHGLSAGAYTALDWCSSRACSSPRAQWHFLGFLPTQAVHLPWWWGLPIWGLPTRAVVMFYALGGKKYFTYKSCIVDTPEFCQIVGSYCLCHYEEKLLKYYRLYCASLWLANPFQF